MGPILTLETFQRIRRPGRASMLTLSILAGSPAQKEAPMSRATRSHPRRPIVMPALILIGLAISAATAQAQGPRSERALLNRTPAATYRVVGRGNQSPSSIDAGNVGVNGVRGSGTFSTPFSGVAANGKDLMWTGTAGGGVPGEMLILLADKGPAIESDRPV